MNPRSVSVIIPTLSAERCRAVLASLAQEGSDFETIVVDNRDTSSIAADPIEEGPARRVLRPGKNLGYSAAVNLAAGEAQGETLVLINDDCTVDEGFVARIAAGVDPEAQVTMAAGVMRQSRRPELIDSAGMELDRTLLVFDYLNGQPLSMLEAGTPDPVGPSGAAAAFDRKTFLAVGGFDENLFAYWEDVDLVLRLRERGGRCRLVADARGTHQHSATLGSGSVEKNRLMGFGRGYVLRKWGVLSPSRIASVVARDLPLALGQAVVDRNLGGVTGRLAGLRSRPEPRSYPTNLPDSTGLAGNLKRRWRRRSGVRGASPTGQVAVVFHSGLMSGPLRSLENEIRWLSSERDVAVLVPASEVTDPLFSRLGVEVVQLDYSVPTLEGGAVGAVKEFRDQWRQIRLLRAFFRDRGTSAVLVVTTAVPSALIAAKREEIPVVLYAAEIPMESNASRDGIGVRFRQVSRRISNRGASSISASVLACSPAVADAISAKPPVSIHYPSIDPALSHGDGAGFRRERGISADGPLVACVGSISPGRGQHVLLEALPIILEAHPDSCLIIVGQPFARRGDRQYSDGLDALIRQLGVTQSVVRIPRVEPIGELLAATNVLVNPALTHAESFGRVAFEAGLAGVPAVVSRVGAVPDLLEDGKTARLVDPGDSGQIARAVLELLDDPSLGDRLAEGAAGVAADIASPDRSLAVFKEAMGRVGVSAS